MLLLILLMLLKHADAADAYDTADAYADTSDKQMSWCWWSILESDTFLSSKKWLFRIPLRPGFKSSRLCTFATLVNQQQI